MPSLPGQLICFGYRAECKHVLISSTCLRSLASLEALQCLGPLGPLKAAVCTVNLAIALLFSTYMDDGVSIEFGHGFQTLQVSNQFVVTFHVNNTLVRREETKALMLALLTSCILSFSFCTEMLLSPVKLWGASCSPVILLSQEEEGLLCW